MILPKLLARLRRRGQAEGISDERAQNTLQIGADAQRLLDDPILKLAFQVLDDEIMERWRNTRVGSRRDREELYRLHVALAELDARLRAWVGDANAVAMAQKRAEEEPASWAA